MAMEIPPGHPVHGEHDSGFRPQQRPDRGGDGWQGRRFGGDDHCILRAKLGRGADARMAVQGFLRGADHKPVRRDRRALGAARDDGYLGIILRQSAGDVAPDRAGAKHADFHDSSSSAARDSACTPSPMQASSGA